MAYKLEKEPTGKYALVIDGWQEGIAADPYSGINRMRVVDLETPGEVAVGYPITTSTTSASGGVTLSTPIADSTRWFGYTASGAFSGSPSGSPQSFAMLDSAGYVWESSSITGTWTALQSNSTVTGATADDGLAYWLGRLFKTRGANIDFWNGSTWTNGWQTTLTAGFKHYMYVGSDNVLYITNGNYLASVTANSVSSFDTGNSGTFTFNAQKLALPYTDVAISIAEVGQGSAGNSMLLVGGIMNAIYPWDKTSVSFNLPIYVAESYIRLMVSANQNAFIFPGNQQGRGRIYITNGSQASEFFKMPDYVFGEQDPYYVWGDAIFHRNNLIFGCFVTQNSGSGTLTSDNVWAIKLDDSKAFRGISRFFSANLKGNATSLISTANLSSPGFGYIVGWTDGTTPHIGYSGTTVGIGSGDLITDKIPVGTFLDKMTFTNVEFKLRSPLESGENIVIAPIVDGTTGSSLTFNPTPTTGSISGYASVNFQNAQWLGFDVTLTGNSATSGVRLKEIRIR